MSTIDQIALDAAQAIGEIDPDKLKGCKAQAIAQAQCLVIDAIKQAGAPDNMLPIALKKLKQLGGEAFGVLVRNESGIMAVTDLGRVTKLDDAVMGPADHIPDATKMAHGSEPVAWDDPAVDPIVSKLYRKFKEWSQRGFTADDVTWCEVRGYVAELLNARAQGAEPVANGEPLPCPFCGSPDVGGASGIVHCYRCFAKIELQNTNTAYAVELWNRRACTQPQSAGLPEGFVLMPESLTAENGAKYALSGEFHEVVELECTACDEDDDDCLLCSGHGSYTHRVPISWTAIKQIYSLAVNNLSAATTPQPAGDKWLYREPDHGEEDYCGQVWTLDANGEIELLSTESCIAEFKTGNECEIIAFQPTGLQPPQPPQQGGE